MEGRAARFPHIGWAQYGTPLPPGLLQTSWVRRIVTALLVMGLLPMRAIPGYVPRRSRPWAAVRHDAFLYPAELPQDRGDPSTVVRCAALDRLADPLTRRDLHLAVRLLDPDVLVHELPCADLFETIDGGRDSLHPWIGDL